MFMPITNPLLTEARLYRQFISALLEMEMIGLRVLRLCILQYIAFG